MRPTRALPARWWVALLVALAVLYFGARCVGFASDWLLAPLWNAPLEDTRR